MLRGSLCTIAKEGTKVVVPYREEDTKRHLKVMGDLGQIVSLVGSLLQSSAIGFRIFHLGMGYPE